MEYPAGLLLIILISLISSVSSYTCKTEPKCKIGTVHGMYSADCFNRDFRNFPKCLTTDIEIIEISQNRIRKLNKDDLQKYTSLKMLYLSDNTIMSINENAFKGLNSLIAIDLSLNSFQKLPPIIFQLPSLKRLYLSQNMNFNIADAIEKSKPISAPLQYIDVSFMTDENDEQFIEFPDFGNLPFLIKLNISGNSYYNMTARYFAGLCNLQILSNVNSSFLYEDECECWKINQWLAERKVIFEPLQCSLDVSRCPAELNHEYLQAYEDCKQNYKTLMVKSTMTKVGMYGSIAVLVVLIFAGLYFYYRRRNRKIHENLNLNKTAQSGDYLIIFSKDEKQKEPIPELL